MRLLPRLLVVCSVLACLPAVGQAGLPLLHDTVLDGSALLFARSAPYGRAINGLAFQTEALLTVGEYQYASWYHFGSGGSQDVYLARRRTDGTAWQVMDTGADMTRTTSDAHNVISMGISAGGAISLAYDHHGQSLRYRTTSGGAAAGSAWNTSLFAAERSSLNPSGATVSSVTYPRFFNDPTTGGLFMTYRSGGSGGGDIMFTAYDEAKGMWAGPHEIIDGLDGISYSDPQGSSTTRNAYMNGVDIDSTGRIHLTWTWRESAGGTNHDILYAYSDDGGWTWRNNAGSVVGTASSPIRIDKPGLRIDDGDPTNGVLGQIDRRNTLMNQQTQVVDGDGRVHMVMWHAADARRNTVTGFTTAPAAYFHYFRDPATGAWERRELPTEFAVGSRPDMGTDANGNLYVAYVSPGPGDAGGYYTDGGLVIATASKLSGYRDWEVVSVDGRDFIGEPRLDPARLAVDGVVSIFLQENSDTVSGRTGTPLHVLDYAGLGNKLAWVGDHGARWAVGTGADWDNDGDARGDNRFAAGDRLVFDDSATAFEVSVVDPVAPGTMTFANTAAHAYAISGAEIAGTGDLVVEGGGVVRLATSAASVAGEARIANGTLALAEGTSLATNSLVVEDAGRLHIDLSAVPAGGDTARITLAAGTSLAGTLELSLAGFEELQLNEAFWLINDSSASGRFDAIVGADLGGGRMLAPVYSATGLAVHAAMAGDANLDGQVDIYDLLALSAGGRFGSGQAAEWGEGDMNLDGQFDVFDLLAIDGAKAYGRGSYRPAVAPASVTRPVPEPKAAGLATGAAAWLIGWWAASRRR